MTGVLKVKKLIPVLLISIILASIATKTAEATLLGGKWPRSGYFTLYYYYGGNHRYYGNIWQGGTNWSNTPTKVYMKPWPGISAPLHLEVYDTYTSATWWGMAAHYPCTGSGCKYSAAAIYMNQRTLDPENDFIRTKVATHEFGHTLGLAHPASSVTSSSVMRQGRLSYNKPQKYDINDLNRIYK